MWNLSDPHPFNFAVLRVRGAAGLPTVACRDQTPPGGAPSVVILRATVFRPGLPVMAGFAERLPVILIPEELLIPAMRDDVIDNGRLDVMSGFGTFGTQRM